MARAKLVCSECGAELAPADAICPGCGAAIERKQAKHGGEHAAPASAAPVPGQTSKRRASGRLEPWQIVAGVAVVGLLGFFVYTEMQRVHVDARPAPVQQAGSPPAAEPQAPRVDIAPLEAAVAADPRDPAALLRLANGLQDNRAFARAIDAYERSLALDPKNPDARVDMGVCYYELGRADTSGGVTMLRTAVQEMELALKYRPDHQPAAFNLGIVHLTMGELETSNRWFSRAVELNPSSELGVRAKRILEQHTITQ